jgi:formylglycine-generating enzyme required for sulfatase activity
MSDPSTQVFLSYSRNDLPAAATLWHALEQAGLVVFKDDTSLRSGDRWLSKLQQAVRGCGAFLVLVGRDGVQRWVGAEVEVALCRHFSDHDDRDRLPIFPVLLGDTAPESLPPFLTLFQNTRWDGVAALPDELVDALRARRNRFDSGPTFDGCPFLGLGAFTRNHARLFFGRRVETLEALAGLGDQTESNPEGLAGCGGSAYKRWLQIEGSSGAGKSSLVQAGMLPMIERGALWARTGFEKWQILGPMMPGCEPVEKLAEVLERSLVADPDARDIDKRQKRLEKGERTLALALRAKRADKTAFLLIIDQFEELFTFADDAPRKTFDKLLAHALQDPECPLFVISTVRADFLDRYEQLPCLGGIYNRLCRRYFLPIISEQCLSEVICGPAQLAKLDVSEVLTAILRDAREEMAGALPLVENGLMRLWEMRRGTQLSGHDYRTEGGLAGMLARHADSLLRALESEHGMAGRGRQGALELLLRLTRISDDGRHSRQRIGRRDAVDAAGNGDTEAGERIVRRLSGERAEDALAGTGSGALRLVVTTIDRDAQGRALKDPEGRLVGHVDLIHETLIRARGKDEQTGKPIGYWPSLYDYIEANRARVTVHRELEQAAREWQNAVIVARSGSSAALRNAESLLWGWERQKAALQTLLLPGQQQRVEDRNFKDPGIQAWRALKGGLKAPLECFLYPEPLRLREELNKGDTRHDRREDIGRRLNQMPDPRRGVGLDNKGLPDIVWESIEAGEVTLETDPPRSFPVRPFRIARYPVTWAQYRAFLKADDGYHDVGCRWWDGLEIDDKPGASEWAFDNHPVINVSWFDAVAFCRWLSHRLGLAGESAVRLPTEQEWQWVAQAGRAKLKYPWGHGWNVVHLNSLKAGIGRTMAVGLYPLGCPRGKRVLDLAGNVREWCLNEHKDTNNCGLSGGADRVLRGGAWDIEPGNCRAATRSHDGPHRRFNDIGFRVCCVSPIETLAAAPLTTGSPGR